MTTDQPAGPWAAWAAFGEPEGLMPGHLVQLRRAEAAERAEEERRASEAQDRADARYERAVWDARQYSAMRGLPWSPDRPFEHSPSVYDKADAMFAAQDLAARQADFKAAQEAGLVHLLHQSPEHVPSPSSGPGPAALAQAGEAARSTRAKIRQALAKMRPTPTRHERHPLATDGREITRSYATGPGRIVG